MPEGDFVPVGLNDIEVFASLGIHLRSDIFANPAILEVDTVQIPLDFIFVRCIRRSRQQEGLEISPTAQYSFYKSTY